ncbi:MAG: hypothetical protein HRU15_20430, partial [Planctomycetes bacterium]|nr:hypothetical protein [Planctomycetota bacterium]
QKAFDASQKTFGDALAHTGLDIAGLIPIAGIYFDLWNAERYLEEGDNANAALATAAAAPLFLGWVATFAKYAKYGDEIVEGGHRALDGADDIGEFVIFNERAASDSARSALSDAVDVFGKNKLKNNVIVNQADEMTVGGNLVRGVTEASQAGDATKVILGKQANAVTYLDEGGHVAGYIGKGADVDHMGLYSQIFNNPNVRKSALEFVGKMHNNPQERMKVLIQLARKGKRWLKK